MNLHQLNLGAMLNCLEIDQHRSINAAARSREVSQPALSRSVQSLEKELGVPLFERSSSGVHPTPFGETLLHHARIVQSELLRCLNDIQERKQTGRMSLRVGASPSVIGWLIMPAVLATYKENDHTNIGLVEGHPDDLMARLVRGDIDLAVQPLADENLADEIVGLPLAQSQMSVIVGAHHPLLRRRRVQPHDLDEYLWLLPSWASGWHRWLHAQLAVIGLDQPRRVMLSNSYQALRQMLLAHDAMAILPVDFLDADLQAGTLRRVALEQPLTDMAYWAYAKRGRALSPTTLAFRDRLVQAAQARKQARQPSA